MLKCDPLSCYLVVASERPLVMGVEGRVKGVFGFHFLQQGPLPGLGGHLGEGIL